MISKNFIITALFISFACIAYIFQNYAMSIIVGLILSIATGPIYKALYKKFTFKNKTFLISFLLTLALFLFVFLPLIYFVGSSYKFIPNINVDQSMSYINNIIGFLKNLPAPLDIFQESINAALSEFNIYTIDMNIIKSIINKIANFFWQVNGLIYQFFLILFFYFLFNYYSKALFALVMKLLPMVKSLKKTLHNELSNTISSVFFGTIFSMVLQGLSFGVFLYLTSDYDAVYLGMASGFVTAIPIVGTYLVAFPLAILELLDQNYLYALSIILFSLVVMSGFIDNVLRIFFMKYLNKKFKLHYSLSEFFILLSMIAGIGVFGAWGIILAPALLSLAVAFIDIYNKSKKRSLS